MKLFFTSLLFLFFLNSPSFSQDLPDILIPPAGTDTLENGDILFPNAYVGYEYNESLVINIPDIFSVNLSDQTLEIPFVSGEINSVSLPDGMTFSCESIGSSDCLYGANSSGTIIIHGTPSEIGYFELELSLQLSLSIASLGLPTTVEFSVPYDGSSVLLNLVVGNDPSIINDVIPNFFINILPEDQNPNLSYQDKENLNFELYPNPVSSDLFINLDNFHTNNPDFTSHILIYDIFGREIFRTNYLKNNLINIDTKNFTNGIYKILINNNKNIIYKSFIVNHQ
jgi:hypothetical protein